MIHREVSDIASEWVTVWSKPEPPAIAAGDCGESVLDWELPREYPEVCWKVILHVLGMIQATGADRHFQVLAAGPLEDLLSNHGEAFIDRVEAEAKRNPAFALLLGGVWQHTMSDEVWTRVQSCAKEPW